MAVKEPVRFIPIHQFQKDVIESRSQLTGFVGGRGAGKTVAGSVVCLWTARDGDYLMAVSPTFPIAKETTFKTFIELAEQTGQLVKSREHPSPSATFRTIDGGRAEITFKSADNPDSLVGRNVAILWFDEASLTAQESFERALGCARHKGSLGRVYCTFTPRGFNHWTFQRFYVPVENPEEFAERERLVYFQEKAYLPRHNTLLVHCPSTKNPFLSQEFVPFMQSNYSGRLQLQELEGMFLEVQGLMFQRQNAQYVEEIPFDCERVRYIDKASTGPTSAAEAQVACYSAMALVGVDRQKRYYLEHMVRGQWNARDRNKVIGQVLERDAYKYQGTVLTYIEQEGAGAGKEVNEDLIRLFSQYPVYTDSAVKSASRTVGGVVLPGDAKIRRAYPFAAQWQNNNVFMKRAEWNADFIDELCVHENSLISTKNGVKMPISCVEPGDMVKTRQGFNRVRVCQPTGRRNLWLLATMQHRLFATHAHPIWCVNNEAFMPLSELKRGDRVLTFYPNRLWQSSIVTCVVDTGHAATVWNMEVEDCNEYVADGFLTHNCMFPEYSRCDQVDAVSGGYLKVARHSIGDTMSATRYDLPIGDRVKHGDPIYPKTPDVIGSDDKAYKTSKFPWL